MVRPFGALGVNDTHHLQVNDLTVETAGIERERSGKIEIVSVPKSYRDDTRETAKSLLSQHKAKQRAGIKLTVAEGFWGARLRFCVLAGEPYESEIPQAIAVYQRAHELGERERSAASTK